MDDLRAEVRRMEGPERAERLGILARDWRAAELSAPDAALCAYAEKLTRSPASMHASDVEELRRSGFDDEAIHAAIQVVAYFNYINRVADAVHVDLEPEMAPYPPSGPASATETQGPRAPQASTRPHS